MADLMKPFSAFPVIMKFSCHNEMQSFFIDTVEPSKADNLGSRKKCPLRRGVSS